MGVRLRERLFSFLFLDAAASELLLAPNFPASEAASLPKIFLAIQSWPALLSAKTGISKELAAPRAKETIYRENYQDRSHFLHILVRIGGIRTIPRRRPSDPTHAASGTATRHAAFSTFNSALAARTRAECATWPATRSGSSVTEPLVCRTPQH